MSTSADFRSTPLLVASGLALIALSGFGFWTYLFRTFPERSALPVVEGRVVPDSICGGDRLRFKVTGYARELCLSRPDAAIERAQARLRLGDSQRVRLRARPWSNNAERASLVELELLTSTSEVLVSYEEIHADHLRDNQAALVIGTTFGLVLLGGVLMCLLPSRRPEQHPPPAGARVSRDFFVERGPVLAMLLPCLGMQTLFGWGISNIPEDPVFLIAVPMVVLFGGTLLALLRDLLRLGPALSVGDRGVSVLGSGRIPWDQLDHVSWEGDVLSLGVNDEEERLRQERLGFRLRARFLAKFGRRAYSVGVAPLDATPSDVRTVLRTHGVS